METPQTTIQEPLADVMELCKIAQCLGFSLKSLKTSGIDSSQEAGVKTIVISCQSSGLHAVLESGNANCSCPIADLHTSSLWQDSGIAGDKQIDKETGSTLLGSLSKYESWKRVARKLREIANLEEHEDTDSDQTLTPEPRLIRRITYVIRSRSLDETFSPIQALPSSSLLENPAEKKAEYHREQLSMLTEEVGGADDGTDDLSMSSLALDASSHFKAAKGMPQYASSPNLSGVASTKKSSPLRRRKRLETVSNPNLNSKKKAQEKEGKLAKQKRRLHLNSFKVNESTGAIEEEDGKTN